GRSDIFPIKYDPRRRCYVETGKFMPPALEAKVLEGAHALNEALGYDMNSVEFACKDGVPYAIDFTNPAPDMDIYSILPKHFHIVVDQMAKFAIASAREGRKNEPNYSFRRFMETPVRRTAS